MGEILLEVLAELRDAEARYPKWPGDVVHGAAIVAEEAGELVRACLLLTYADQAKSVDEASVGHVRREAVQTAAMALRFLKQLDDGGKAVRRAM